VLEFLGDSVLSAAIVTLLMQDGAKRYRYGILTKLNEGDFSNIKSALSDKKNLSLATRELGIAKYLLLGEGDKVLNIADEPSVMEDLFESIIGAVYLDSDRNLTVVVDIVSKLLDVKEYLKGGTVAQSAKNTLQEYCAAKDIRLPPPIYKTLSEDGPDHKKVYERGCFIGERLVAKGVGKNHKEADARAAEAALKVLKSERK